MRVGLFDDPELLQMPGVPVGNRVVQSQVLLEAGHLDQARSSFEAMAADDFDSFARDYLWLGIMHGVANLAHGLSDGERAGVLYRRLAPYAGRNACIAYCMSDGPVDRILALLAHTTGDLDTADRHFADAERLCEQMQMPTYLARTRLQWAQMLDQRNRPGDPTRARQLAGQALAAAEKLGMAQVAEQARQLLGDSPGS